MKTKYRLSTLNGMIYEVRDQEERYMNPHDGTWSEWQGLRVVAQPHHVDRTKHLNDLVIRSFIGIGYRKYLK